MFQVCIIYIDLYSLFQEFSGCMTLTNLGVKIVDCNSCFCDLRNKSVEDSSSVKSGPEQTPGMMFSSSLPQSELYVVARICMERQKQDILKAGTNCVCIQKWKIHKSKNGMIYVKERPHSLNTTFDAEMIYLQDSEQFVL